MDITAKLINHEPVEFDFAGHAIPVVVGWQRDGAPVTARDLATRQLLDSADCDHAGATWSSNLHLRCPRCGSHLFLPPRYLAHLPTATLAAMDELWSAAGWPAWEDMAWAIASEHWHIASHPLYDYLGGLPVRIDRQQQYDDALTFLADEL